MAHCAADTLVLALVDRVWNHGRTDELENFFADKFQHDGRDATPAELREWHRAEALTWTDARYEVLDCVCDGTKVAVRWRSVATLIGDWGPVTGRGQRIEGDGAHFFTVEAGRITAVRSMADVFAKAVQLNVRFLPPEAVGPAQAAAAREKANEPTG